MRKYNIVTICNRWIGLALLAVSVVGFSGIITNTNLNFLMMIPSYAAASALVFMFICSEETYIQGKVSKLL